MSDEGSSPTISQGYRKPLLLFLGKQGLEVEQVREAELVIYNHTFTWTETKSGAKPKAGSLRLRTQLDGRWLVYTRFWNPSSAQLSAFKRAGELEKVTKFFINSPTSLG